MLHSCVLMTVLMTSSTAAVTWLPPGVDDVAIECTVMLVFIWVGAASGSVIKNLIRAPGSHPVQGNRTARSPARPSGGCAMLHACANRACEVGYVAR